MNQQFIVFFSWQSDEKQNKTIIRRSIMTACKAIEKNNGYSFVYDESTRDVPGSPDIPSTVFEKIRNCDIFVADITPIAQRDGKAIPNPNVLVELGYALQCHGNERIITVLSKGDYKDYQLPFDINHFRHGNFDNTKNTCNLEFEILESVKYILDNGKFQYNRFFNKFHLQQNIVTGKYLPNVFLEDDKLKEHLRYFLHPAFFYKKFYEEIATISFDYYNQKAKLNDWPQFEYSVQDYPNNAQGLDLLHLRETIEQLSEFLLQKTEELRGGYTQGYYVIHKIKQKIKSAKFFTSNICLLTAKAGQGKTNLVCDIVEHILLPHFIPFAYINGYEIDANNVGESIAKILYPEQNFSIGDLVGYIERFCIQQKKYFVLIIDGLNETTYSSTLKNNLQHLLDVLLQKKYVKVILTCRTEYYNQHFSDLLSLFEESSIVSPNIYHHLNNNQKDVLIENYCDFFDLHVHFSEKIKDTLGTNLLLLRIFCEVYKNQTLGRIINLQKEQLFSAYYKTMQDNVITQLNSEGLHIMKSDLSFFLKTMMQLMIEKDSFSNVKLDDILFRLSTPQRHLIHRFLDSNIIVKKDLGGIFGGEVVNFTFDEFRDFLLSHYLIDEIATTSFDRFKELVAKYTTDTHVLNEGLTCYLYLCGKESSENTIMNYIRTLPWYKKSFLNYVWDIREEKINDRDITDMSIYLLEEMEVARILLYERWNVCKYKINIRIILNMIQQFEDSQLYSYIQNVWSTDKSWHREYSLRENLINQMQRVLNEFSFEEFDLHPLFEHSLYLAPFDYGLQQIYQQYYTRFNPQEQVNRVYRYTHSKKLKSYIENNYEILL